jgi:hypothetical protein
MSKLFSKKKPLVVFSIDGGTQTTNKLALVDSNIVGLCKPIH